MLLIRPGVMVLRFNWSPLRMTPVLPKKIFPARNQPTPPAVSRIRQTAVSGDREVPVPERELLKGHEIAPDRYVTFTRQELKALRPQTSTEMQIVRTVHLEEIDPVYFETSYYVAPDRGGERAYSLLFAALKESRFVALAAVTMNGRENVVVIRPALRGLLAHTMFFRDEIRAESEYDAGFELAPKELQLAKTFVDAIAGPFDPGEFRDTRREKLESLIAGKIARNEVSVAAASIASSAEAVPAKTVDIMDALRRSIQAAKKPPQSAAPAPRRQKRKA